MASDWAGKAASGAFSSATGGLFAWRAGWAGGGFSGPLIALGGVLGLGIGFAFRLQHQRYLLILGTSVTIGPRATVAAKADHAYNRGEYLRIRASLAEGGKTATLYADTLRAFLNGVDRFFGDKGPTCRSWIHDLCSFRATPALWTAPAYDRCLLLALQRRFGNWPIW